MLLISNHLLKQITVPADAIVRINIAWVKTPDKLEEALQTPYDVFIDYPEGRTKPPVPKISFYEIMQIVKRYKNVKYVGVSNIESGNIAGLFKSAMVNGISFVPKIETAKGINNIDSILAQSLPQYIMLDTEDLFTDVNCDVLMFEKLIEILTQKCFSYHTNILKISGVVFSD